MVGERQKEYSIWGSVLVVEKDSPEQKKIDLDPLQRRTALGAYNALMSETATGDTAGFLNFMPLHPDLLMDFKVSAS